MPNENSTPLNWRIYYGDGSTFSSDDGLPQDSPPWGVVAIVSRNGDDPREISVMMGTGFDYFVWDGVDWWGGDFVGLIDRLATRTAHVVCFGRTITTDQYQKVTQKASKDRLI